MRSAFSYPPGYTARTGPAAPAGEPASGSGRHAPSLGKLPERAIRYGAAAAFLVFGPLLIADGAGLL